MLISVTGWAKAQRERGRESERGGRREETISQREEAGAPREERERGGRESEREEGIRGRRQGEANKERENLGLSLREDCGPSRGLNHVRLREDHRHLDAR